MSEMLDRNGPGHFGSSFALGFSEPNLCEKFEVKHFRTNPEPAMASSATSATSFELIEDQTLTAEEVEMASQEAQEIRTREAAVAAGLVLDEPEAPPSASATDVMNDLSSALERLRVAFSTPTSGLGAPGPAEEEDKEMGDADATERATPPTKRLKGFVAASQKTTAPVNKPVSLVPVEGRPGYFKLVDLPDLFPVLPASAATLLRDVTVEEAVSLFHKFVGKNLTEDLVIRILEAYVPMKIQIRQEEVWGSGPHSSRGIRRALAPSTDSMPATQTTNSCVSMRHGVAGGSQSMLGLPGQGVCPLPGTLGYLRGGRHHLQPGQADLDPAAGWGKPGCHWPRWYPGTGRPQPGGRHGLGRAPPKTDTAEEIAMADVVPLNRRVDIRQEILSMEADDQALKVRERQKVKVKVQRSLQEAEAQSFQLYHPQVDQAIRKKEELHKALREHREPTPGGVLGQAGRKELVTNEMLDNEMAILAPLQEDMQGAPALRKVNLERFKAKLRTQDVSAWPDDLRQALERGLFCPLELDDPEDIPNAGGSERLTPAPPLAGGDRPTAGPGLGGG